MGFRVEEDENVLWYEGRRIELGVYNPTSDDVQMFLQGHTVSRLEDAKDKRRYLISKTDGYWVPDDTWWDDSSLPERAKANKRGHAAALDDLLESRRQMVDQARNYMHGMVNLCVVSLGEPGSYTVVDFALPDDELLDELWYALRS